MRELAAVAALLGVSMWLAAAWPQSARDRFAAAVAHDMCAPPHSCQAGLTTAQASADDYTPTTWAQTLLAQLGLPQTASNLRALAAWEHAEGGHWSNSARFNPLNTTQRMPGSWSMNAVGVQAYMSWQQGLDATGITLRYPAYAGVRAALAAGGCAPCVAGAVAGSPWGTGWFAT